MSFSRRSFLRNSASALLVSNMMLGRPHLVSAQTSPNMGANFSGYKALVCIFLFGGMDGYDVILPYDEAGYSGFSTLRQDLFNQYGAARARENLLALSGGPDITGARQYALPPEMPNLNTIYQDGDAAIIANIGPLLEPTNRTAIETGIASLPARLFSHNDQQSTWMSGSTEGAQLGWGGLFIDALIQSGSNLKFPTVNLSSGDLFLTGNVNSSYNIATNGPSIIEALDNDDPWTNRLRDHMRADGQQINNIISRDMAHSFRRTIDDNAVFEQQFKNSQSLSDDFTNNGLSQQLRAVARTISIRQALGADRQIFFVGLGGFDTHSAQAGRLPGLLSTLDNAILEFHSTMQSLGLSDEVTLFTASDFGRTVAINGDGTDHGWGNHSFVVGGAVNGGRFYGDMPEYVLTNEQTTGQSGRIIPNWSVDQMAASLGSWFGLSNDQINTAFPRLGRFDGAISGLMGQSV